MSQFSLWDGRSLQERFMAFHHAHPEVYDELRAMALLAKSRGRRRFGIAMFFEVLRWNRIVANLPDETEDFKLNNDYRSRYARLLMAQEPELKGFFEIRTLRAA